MAWYNPTDPRQRNMMVGGIFALILIYPFQAYVIGPRKEENQALQDHVESLEVTNRRASVLAAQGGGDLEERMALYERHVTKLEELIPGEEEVAILADDISNRARSSRVQVQRMVPEPRQPGAYYDKTAYDMAVVGEYHNVARFLTEVASLSRIVTPVELDVQLYAQPQQFPEMVAPVLATFRIETYVLPDQRAAQPDTAPGA